MEREDGILLVVAEVNCRYRSAAFYDDEVIIRTRIGESKARMIRFEYEMIAADDGRVIATGETNTCSAAGTASHARPRQVLRRARNHQRRRNPGLTFSVLPPGIRPLNSARQRSQ